MEQINSNAFWSRFDSLRSDKGLTIDQIANVCGIKPQRIKEQRSSVFNISFLIYLSSLGKKDIFKSIIYGKLPTIYTPYSPPFLSSLKPDNGVIHRLSTRLSIHTETAFVNFRLMPEPCQSSSCMIQVLNLS